MPQELDFLFRPVDAGYIAHWELYAEDHVDLAAVKVANVALAYRRENDARYSEAAARLQRAQQSTQKR